MGDRQRPMSGPQRAAKVWICLFLVATVTWFACAPRGMVRRISPGNVRWESIRDVAVRGFDGYYGEIVRAHICDRLAQIQYFNPTEALQIYAAGELPSNTVDEVEFLKAVEDLKADAVITGHVMAHIQDIHGVDQVQVREGTGYFKKAKNAYGQWVDEEIKRTVIKIVPYVIRKASVAAEYKVFALLAKGVIALGEFTEVYAEKFGGDKEYSDSGKRLADLPPSTYTLSQVSVRVAERIVAKLSRMRLSSFVQLDKGTNRTVKQGVAMAKDGKWEEAIQIWEQVIRDEPDNAAAYYNLGVAYEGLGDMEDLVKARALYQSAASYGEKSLYAAGMKRVDDVINYSRNH
jgi:tetratricopeptide (TPR) repeat protein